MKDARRVNEIVDEAGTSSTPEKILRLIREEFPHATKRDLRQAVAARIELQDMEIAEAEEELAASAAMVELYAEAEEKAGREFDTVAEALLYLTMHHDNTAAGLLLISMLQQRVEP
jgi:hypothetical protein